MVFQLICFKCQKKVKFPEIDFSESNPLKSNLSNMDTEGTEQSVHIRIYIYIEEVTTMKSLLRLHLQF